jgi:hypothetical protein
MVLHIQSSEYTDKSLDNFVVLRCGTLELVGRLVVVIDVNPSHGFWTARLMRVFGHEGKYK